MKPKLPNFVILLILTALTVFLWIGLTVYRSVTVKPAPVVPDEISNPLNPVLDKTVITEIENRVAPVPIQVIDNTPVEDINIEEDNTDLNFDDINIDI